MNLKEVCQTLSREIQKLVPYDRLAINLPQKDENYFRVYAEESRLPASAIPDGLSVREGTATGWVFDHHEPVICRDILRDSRFPLTHKRYKDVGLRSYVILPLMAKGKTLGVLNLASLKPRCYGKKQVEILSPIAEILAVAVENSNLYEEAQRREEIQKLLKELSQAITTFDIDTLLKKLTEKVREFFKVDISDVRVTEKGISRVVGVSGGAPEGLQRSRRGRGRWKWFMTNRKALSIPDITKKADCPVGETTRQLGIRGYLGLPLLSRDGEVLGVLRALTYQPREFTQEEVDLLQQLANGAAIALEDAKLIANLEATNSELERSIREQHALRALLSSLLLLDLDRLLQRLTEQAVSLFKAEYAWLRLFDEQGQIRTRATAGDENVVTLMSSVREEGRLVGRGRWMLDNHKPLAIRDMAKDADRSSRALAAGLHGFIGAPLFSRAQKPLGVIHAMTRLPRDFSQRDLDLIEQFANAAVIAIENAGLFKEVQKKSAELEEALKAKSAFLNTMAHELKTPLNVIVGVQQLFLDRFYGELTEQQKKGLEPIGRNARDQLNLIDEILNLARLEVKRVPLKIEEFPIKKMIHELESSFIPLVREKGLYLRMEIEKGLESLRSDRSKLQNLLQNLLSNAVKYTDKGGVELRVASVADLTSNGGRVSFSVRDTGTGIKETNLPHIFEAFYMAEGVDRKKYPGSGLGLTIVKRLVELLKGEIRVESEWGKGSTFTVALPVTHTGNV